MIESKFLYHASPNGEIKLLEPRKPNDWSDSEDNKKIGVYTTGSKRWALTMGVLQGGKANPSSISLTGDDFEGIYYTNAPVSGDFYLYSFDPSSFENIPKGSHQFISLKEVKPLKVEHFKVEDYLNLVRPANEKEMKKFRELDIGQ